MDQWKSTVSTVSDLIGWYHVLVVFLFFLFVVVVLFFSHSSSYSLHPPSFSISLSLFFPRQCGREAENFDRFFTRHPPVLTPPDQELIANLDQDEFQGFSFVNPEYTHTTHWPCHTSQSCSSNPHFRNINKKDKTSYNNVISNLHVAEWNMK